MLLLLLLLWAGLGAWIVVVWWDRAKQSPTSACGEQLRAGVGALAGDGARPMTHARSRSHARVSTTTEAAYRGMSEAVSLLALLLIHSC